MQDLTRQVGRRVALTALAISPIAALALAGPGEPPRPVVGPVPWPSAADRARMAEDCRIVAVAESGGPPAPAGTAGRLARAASRLAGACEGEGRPLPDDAIGALALAVVKLIKEAPK